MEAPTQPRPVTFVSVATTLDFSSSQHTLTTHSSGNIYFSIRPVGDAMSDSAPITGRLVPLRTKDEVRASLETDVVYVAEVPAKHANVVKE